jgi:nucleoside-diphosphate-sugar epimerase
MARRPFDPAEEGWKRTDYVRGDVLDRDSVASFVAGADVVVHLAFLIVGGPEEARRINLEGSRNVFEATVAAGAARLVYTSSVAAYGFIQGRSQPLTEDVPARGTESFYYSAQKAELERVLDQVVAGSEVEAYVFRPCIVAGPDSPALIKSIPYVRLRRALPPPVRRAVEAVPLLKPVLPDPGVPFQLVHADDVALALRAAVLGRGEPGVYNLAAEDELTITDLADALGWHAIPLPGRALDVSAEIAPRIPFAPPQAAWLQALRTPTLMSAAKARSKLRWRPQHTGRETLRETVRAARASGLLG